MEEALESVLDYETAEKRAQGHWQNTLNAAYSGRGAASICCVPGCNHKVIKSHLLQERGALNELAQDGHVYESLFAFGFLGDTQYKNYFKRRSMGKATRFPGFCGSKGQNHDCEIFRMIESGGLQMTSYNALLRMLFKAVCWEYKKNVIWVDAHKKILNDPYCFKVHSRFIEPQRKCVINAERFKFFIQVLWHEILNPTGSIDFEIEVIPERLNLAVSTVRTTFCVSKLQTYLDALIVLPKNHQTIVALAKTKSDPFLVWLNRGDKKEIRIPDHNLVETAKLLINKTFFQRGGNWVFSQNFYEKNIKPKEALILNALDSTVGNDVLDKELPNIFQEA